ncbi:MAG: hypothetical protein HOL04_01905 [Gammaproteobacteria bacterium]|nr:hypothetical protein [Gammaproteobacteria bacterium]MBT4608034.1 hypothetical protein [Thiotrichales bacterium]MBT3471952.1 hypothetical protein [Gammaproteobacteria bacterium]MBT3966375.1 hypothetical protein [Gammaproteobacteria bacterium]MBT4080384.1 hypothetical protein [Gammaproteobacteria bacterium]
MEITLTDALIVAGSGMVVIWLFLWYINTHPKGCCGIRRSILKEEDLPLNRVMRQKNRTKVVQEVAVQ